MNRESKPQSESENALTPWITEPATELLRTHVFTVHEREARSAMHPDRAGTFTFLDCPTWVNVIAITPPPDEKFVLIEQYRHGLDQITLEIPGGAVDEGEDPLNAALRELKEESGYGGDDAEIIGRVSGNPAIQNNWVYTALVRDARQVAEPTPDEQEEIRVLLASKDEVLDMVHHGDIHHAFVVAAFMHLLLRER